MGKHSFYGNVINPPKFLQHIQGEDNTNFTVDSLGDTFKISGDNYISTLISNNQLIINHINKNKNLQQPFNHNQINNPQDSNNLYGTILSLPIITAINIDHLGHTTHLAMQDYNFSLIGKKYNGSGEIFNDYGANVASGLYSHSEGKNTQALGNSSHSEGSLTIAQGNYSHSEGYKTQSLSTCAHSEGEGTQAQTAYTHAEGYYSTASDDPNDTQGGVGAHAEGYKTKALGRASHAEGALSEATGRYSHAEGQETIAQGYYSHTQGLRTQAIGAGSYAGGYLTKTYAPYSCGFGSNIVTRNTYSAAFGKFNTNDNKAIFQIGWGDAEENRKDLFKVTTDGYVKIPTSELQAYEVVATKNNVKLSEMPIKIQDEEKQFTIQQGNSEPIVIKKPYNAMVNNAEIKDGSKLILHVNGPDSKDIELEVDLSEVLIDAQVTSSKTIKLETIASGEKAGYIQGTIIPGSITEDLIKSEAIVTQKIANNAITNDKIDYGIDGNKIVDNSITNDKINTVSFEKITGNIPTNRLEGKIITDQLANNLITREKLSNEFYNQHIESKMEKNNPTGVGNLTLTESSISINRAENSTIGPCSATFGLNNQATQHRSFAMGYQTIASGYNSHSQGYNTIASGNGAHAEGWGTNAIGNYQHVIGKFNIPGSNYAYIVGNGTDENSRSNAFTIDWNGNVQNTGNIISTGIEANYIILHSCDEGSNKKFKLTINDEAVISLEEV